MCAELLNTSTLILMLNLNKSENILAREAKMTSLGGVRGASVSDRINVQTTKIKTSTNVLTEEVRSESFFQQAVSFSVCLLLVGAGITVGIWAALNGTDSSNTTTNTTL